MARPTRARARDPFAQSEAQGPAAVLTQTGAELYYDYGQLPSEQREMVRRAARVIKPLLKRTAEDIFIIGGELRAVKEMLPHGRYTDWLGVEFGLSERMAQHFVNVRERLGPKSEKFSVLPPSTLYMLAAPSTPDEAIAFVEARIDAGDRLSVAHVQRTIESLKQQARPTPTTIDVTPTPTAAPLPTPLELAPALLETLRDQPGNADVDDPTQLACALVDYSLTQAIDALSAEDRAVAQAWRALFQTRDVERILDELVEMRKAARAAARKAKRAAAE